jgi:hypothetical protein
MFVLGQQILFKGRNFFSAVLAIAAHEALRGGAVFEGTLTRGKPQPDYAEHSRIVSTPNRRA